MKVGQVVCGARVSRGVQGDASAILPMMRRGQCFVTAGDCHLAVWTVDLVARNVRSLDVAMLKLKRHVLCMDRNERDEVGFFCTIIRATTSKLSIGYVLWYYHR